MKTCSKCKIKKDVSLFSSNKRNKDLLDCYCKDCKKIIREEKREQNKSFSKKYYEANKGKWTEHRKSNADNIRLNAKNWRKENKDYISDKAKEWRKSNPEKMKEYSKRSAPYKKAYGKEWVKKNKDKIRIYRHNIRAKEKSINGTYYKKDIDFLLKKQKGKCVCCPNKFKITGYHIDHIMPLAKGGSNNKDNIQLLCPPCNRLKSDKHPVDFMQRKGFLL